MEIEKEIEIDGQTSSINIDFWDVKFTGEDFSRIRIAPRKAGRADIVLICFNIASLKSVKDLEERVIPELDHVTRAQHDQLRILVGLQCDKRYDFEVLIYGYINEMEQQNNGLQISQDVIAVIIKFTLDDRTKSQYDNHFVVKNAEEIVEENEINGFKDKCNADHYIETSAKYGWNMDNIFETVVKIWLRPSNSKQLKTKSKCGCHIL